MLPTKEHKLGLVYSSVADPDPYVFGLMDPYPDTLDRGMDPDPSTSKNSKKNKPSFLLFCDFL
jgi:hypothetical protein